MDKSGSLALEKLITKLREERKAIIMDEIKGNLL